MTLRNNATTSLDPRQCKGPWQGLSPLPASSFHLAFPLACCFPRRSSIERTKPPRTREWRRKRENDRFTAGSDRRPSHDFWFAGGRLESFGISIDSTGHRERGSLSLSLSFFFSLCGNILPPDLHSKRFCQVLMHRLNSLACLPASYSPGFYVPPRDFSTRVCDVPRL